MGAFTPLVHEYRGDTLDLIHFGHIAIVDENSQLIYGAGDPCAVVFYRSASKPIQALPTIRHGLDREFGLTNEETAIFMTIPFCERHKTAMKLLTVCAQSYILRFDSVLSALISSGIDIKVTSYLLSMCMINYYVLHKRS